MGARPSAAVLALLAGSSALVCQACGASSPARALCAASAPPPDAARALVLAGRAAGPPSSPTGGAVDLAVRLRPSSPDAKPPHIDVDLRARGVVAATMAWSIAEAAPDASAIGLAVEDDAGVLGFRVVPGAAAKGGLHIVLDRPPRGALHARYAVPASSAWRARVWMQGDRALADAEALLLLPDANDPDERLVDASVVLDGEALHASAAASSFGLGARHEGRARLFDLRHAAFLFGELGHAHLETPQGETDESAWSGVTAFEPRWFAAETSVVRTHIGEWFKDGSSLPFMLLVVAEGRRSEPIALAVHTQSLALRVDFGVPAKALRVPVAAELARRWIGGRVWIGARDRDGGEGGYWFSEGFTRFVAREVLFDMGTITSDDYVDEIDNLIGVTTTSPLRELSNDALAQRIHDGGGGDGDGRAAGALLAMARGALYATRLDALVRARSAGERSMREVVGELLDAAKGASGHALPIEAWEAAVARETGGVDEVHVFERTALGGAVVAIPAGGLGPCFAPAPMTFARFDLGFDAEGAAGGEPRAIETLHLREGGPAWVAGLRPGDVVTSVRMTPGRWNVPAEVVVERGAARAPTTVRYLPASDKRSGVEGWTRVPSGGPGGVPEDRCGR